MHGTVLPFPRRPSRFERRLDWFARSPRVLLALWLVYLVLRILSLMTPVRPEGDAVWYLQGGLDLANGAGLIDHAGHPSALLPPGWPIVLSLLFRQFGTSPVVVGLFNLACAALIGQLTLAFGRRLLSSEGAARAGFLLLAFHPGSIAQIPLIEPVLFYTALLMSGCWAIVTRTHPAQTIGAGLLLGAATLVFPMTLLAVPLLFALDWLRRRDLLRSLPRVIGEATLVLAFAAMTVLPWTMRNHEQLGRWIPVSTAVTSVPALLPDTPSSAARLQTLWLGRAPIDATIKSLARICDWILLAGFVAAFAVMTIRRIQGRQHWIDWWLLPYIIALQTSIAALIGSSHPMLRFAVTAWICLNCGWLVMIALSRTANPPAPAVTIH